MRRFDILFVADGRFEGGASTALAVEIRAAARAGLTTGLLLVKGPLLGFAFPVHPRLRALMDDGVTERLDPGERMEARLVLIHHPTIFENRPTRPLFVTGGAVVVVLHHPMRDRIGREQYKLARVVANAADAFGDDVGLAPVSGVVRRSLPAVLPPRCRLLPEDWHNLIEAEEWPERGERPVGTPVVIGRHSRPDPLKWPTRKGEAFRAYPGDGSRYSVRIMGADAYLGDLYGELPGNWELLPFSSDGVADFLAGLDFYVYYHSDAWSEAFGRTILEALAVGLPVILPHHFEELFGEAAVYSNTADVEKTVARLAEPGAYAAQAAKARAFVAARHDAGLFAGRLARLFALESADDGPATAPAPPLPRRQVLFLSSNGIGMGHLVQQLAVAARLDPSLTAVFATMSHAMRIAVEEGYLAHFLTYHRHIGASSGSWNRVLAEELFDLLAHHRPAVLAYDATVIFQGVVDALASFPDVFSIWVRRPMWRASHAPFLEHAGRFDAVVEPGELAEDFDHGPTRQAREGVLLVPPVLHIEPSSRMSRKAAREALGLPPEGLVCAVQLGSGANFDMKPARRAVIEALLARGDTVVLELRSPIRPQDTPDEPLGQRHRIVRLHPHFRYSLAFDAAVSAAGYNSFHENVLGGVPTLFVPNEAEDMDLQLNRARWGELTGCCRLMRRDHDLPNVSALVEALLDPVERAAMTRRCRALPWRNGAHDIARYVEDHARLVRTDYDVTKL